MVKEYRKKINKEDYLKNGLMRKINAAIKAHAHKNYILFKKVISKNDANRCIYKKASGSQYKSIQGNTRLYDQAGTKAFTDFLRAIPIRFNLKETDPKKKMKFKDFYGLVAKSLGMQNAVVGDHDRVVLHKENLEKLQAWHIDANVDDITTVDNKVISGYGDGFSAFLGLSEQNSIWTAEFSPTDNQIHRAERILFSAGDCLVLKYGTVHRGDSNDTSPRIPRFKAFTDVNSGKAPDSKAQLWVVEGAEGGYTTAKPSD